MYYDIKSEKIIILGKNKDLDKFYVEMIFPYERVFSRDNHRLSNMIQDNFQLLFWVMSIT